MPEVRLISEAAVPKIPSSPRRGMLTASCFVGGLVVAIGLALLLEYLNRKIRSVREIEEFVGIKVLATVPRISWRRWRQAGLV
jgi:capsular polysaccharide biosynthesis protein